MKTKVASGIAVVVLFSIFFFAFTISGVAESVNHEIALTSTHQTPQEPSFATSPSKPILNELDVRKAIAYCTDRWALARVVYPELTDPEIDALMMDSFLPSDHWAYTQPTTQYPYDPDQGRTLLEAAGWTLPEGGTYRVNSQGEPLAIQLTTTGSAMRYAWGPVFEQQMMDCGIWVLRFHTDANWLFGEYTGLVRRNFEMSGFAWDIDDDPQPIGFYGCGQIPSYFNGWLGQNYMGWCNPIASEAAEIASDTNLTHEERIPYFAILQEEFAQDMPSLPLYERVDGSWEHIDFTMFSLISRIFIPVINK